MIELEISLKAGEIVGKLYDALKLQYINPDSDESLQSLNKLCVRLVFCLYAESTGIFGKRKIFHDYLSGSRNIRQDLILLFDVLNKPEENRDPYLDFARFLVIYRPFCSPTLRRGVIFFLCSFQGQ